MDGKGWSSIIAYVAQKNGQQAIVKLHEHYEDDAGEVNKQVAWVMANIDNAHYTSKHAYASERMILLSCITMESNGKRYAGENQGACLST